MVEFGIQASLEKKMLVGHQSRSNITLMVCCFTHKRIQSNKVRNFYFNKKIYYYKKMSESTGWLEDRLSSEMVHQLENVDFQF